MARRVALMAKSLKAPYLEKDEKRGNLQVWIVDGSYVRGHIDEEFTNFGQHLPLLPTTQPLVGWWHIDASSF
jgi:hypothetical protein